MNTTVNPLIALVGGGSMADAAGANAQPNSGFAQLLNSAPAQDGEITKSMTLVFQASGLVKDLKALEATGAIDLSKVTIEDLKNLFAGQIEVLSKDGLSSDKTGSDLEQLMKSLKDLQELLRDFVDIFPQFAADFTLPTEAGQVSFAAIIEVVQFVSETAEGQASLQGAQPALQLVPAGSRAAGNSMRPETRPLPSLSLVSDIGGISVPEPQVKEAISLTPNTSAVFRTMVTGIIHAQKTDASSMGFEASDTPLALAQRPEQTLLEQLEQPQATQQTQRPENQISTKFAAVLVNQVRAVDIQEGTTRIELSPRGLGSIEIEMRTNADGSLAVVVRAENDAVLSSLREERDLLAAIIGENASGSLDFQEYSQGQNDEQSGQNGTGLMSSSEEETADGPADETPIVNGPELNLVT